MTTKQFTHLDEKNNASMVDVSNKETTLRVAEAEGYIKLPKEVFQNLIETPTGQEIQTKKGGVFQTARIAATMGAKKTYDLIPLCHQLILDAIKIDITLERDGMVWIKSLVKTKGPTGVEMEALTAVNVGLLTIYDMCKAFSHEMEMGGIKLLSKSGGRRDIQRSGEGNWIP